MFYQDSLSLFQRLGIEIACVVLALDNNQPP